MRILKIIGVNIILIGLFIGIAFLIVDFFWSEAIFNNAQKLAAEGKISEAEKAFEDAIMMNPGNSKYYGDFAKFLVLRLPPGEKNIGPDRIRRAEDLYKKAITLNPRCPDYALGLGEIKLKIFSKTGNTIDVKEAFLYFRKAIKEDPNSLNLAYIIGYTGMAFWKDLNEEERKLIVDRLAYCLKIQPSYSRYIFPRAWNNTKDLKVLEGITKDDPTTRQKLYLFIIGNNLWSRARNKGNIIEFFSQGDALGPTGEVSEAEIRHINSLKEKFKREMGSGKITLQSSKRLWRGLASNGKTEIIDGYLYRNGTVYTGLNMKPGIAIISIQAKKRQVINISDPKNPKYYPYIVAALDGVYAGGAFVRNDEWDSYDFTVRTDGGIRVLSVAFINDVYDPKKGEDRNVYVGDVKISYE